jgi:hypothetical protein
VSDKILVDTSAWILSFKDKGNEDLKDYLRKALDSDKVVIAPIIMLELLQGCKHRKEYEILKERLEILQMYEIRDNTWSIAYEAGFLLRRKGVTVPTIDILIASIAKENMLTILHHDSHLEIISTVMAVKTADFI